MNRMDISDSDLYFSRLRDEWALKALPAPEWIVTMHRNRDRQLNEFNEPHKPKIRSEAEISSDYAYQFADEALTQARGRTYTDFLRRWKEFVKNS